MEEGGVSRGEVAGRGGQRPPQPWDRPSPRHDERAVDVASRLCAHEGCNKHPCFGPPGKGGPQGRGVAKWCAICAAKHDKGAVDVVSRLCAHEGCNKHATFGPLPDDYAESLKRVPRLFCSEHAPPEYVHSVSVAFYQRDLEPLRA